MPATIASLLAGKWFIDGAVGEFFCNLSAFLDNTAIGCSVWFLALSSFDRYVYICIPPPPLTPSATTLATQHSSNAWRMYLYS